MNSKVVSVVGLGYIGLPTAAVFASHGVRVIGLDIEPLTVETINRGEIHIVEPGLEALVCATVKSGFLRATTQAEPADAFLIAVPTPFKGDNEPDLSYIESAGKAIARVLKAGDLVILESTSPVGTTEKLADWLAQARPDLTFPQVLGDNSDIRIAHCPERVLPGQVLRELVQNDRVIGGMSAKCSVVASELYKLFVKGDCVITNARTAEMCKLTENSFRDVNIAFANELSMICDKLNVDVWELIRLANRHPRVNILRPGPGVGGHCIAVDPWFIVHAAPVESRMIGLGRQINDEKPLQVVDIIKRSVARKRLVDSQCLVKIAFLGLSYKADIDDLRESPALKIVNLLAESHSDDIMVVEPYAVARPLGLHSCARVVTLSEAVNTADVIVVLVAHSCFKNIDFDAGKNQAILDVCGALGEAASELFINI